MRFITAATALMLSMASPVLAAKNVDCSKGESVNAALGKLSKTGPERLTISGTCTENIVVTGFDDLTLIAASGATLNATADGSFSPVIRVDASRRVTLSGFVINAGQQQAIALWDSVQCRVEGVTVNGGGGIRFQRNASGEVVDSLLQNMNIGLLAANGSTAFVRGTVLENTTIPRSGTTGMFVIGFAAAVLEGVTLRGFGTGVNIRQSVMSVVGPSLFGSSRPNLIENNNTGILINPSGTLSLVGGTLTISGNGNSSVGPAGNFSGGIVLDGGTVSANPFTVLTVDGNVAQGLVASNHSVIELAGGAVTVSNNQLNGIAIVNDSLVEFRTGLSGAKVTVTGSGAQDIFCANDSMLRGASNLIGATKIQCADQLPFKSAGLPGPGLN